MYVKKAFDYTKLFMEWQYKINPVTVMNKSTILNELRMRHSKVFW